MSLYRRDYPLFVCQKMGRKVKHSMNKQLGKKAKQRVDLIEQEYVKRHGKLPDYHYTELWNQYGGAVADKIIQDNINAIWADMQECQNPTFRAAGNNPFDKPNSRN